MAEADLDRAWLDANAKHHMVDLSGARLHVVEAGEGPLVVLLHGFPEFWYSWHRQIPVLVRAGYKVVAPDMRGYNKSSKPARVADYHADHLARDIAELVDLHGEGRARLAGHDWGGMAAWWWAQSHPHMVERLAVLNCPHPGHAHQMLTDVHQLRRSWYMFFIQLPWLPEQLMARDDFAYLRRTFTSDTVRPGAFSSEDIERYVEAMRQPGAVTGAMNYYRAFFRDNPVRLPNRLRPIDTPVLVLWGARDRYLRARFAKPPTRWVPHSRVVSVEDASHWLQVDRPAVVNDQLVAYFADDPSAAGRAAS